MKKRNLLMALSVTAVTVITATAVSCSDDDDVPYVNTSSDNAIRFAAGTEFSRAGDITTNNLTEFNVYAYTDESSGPNLFMNNVTVSKTGTNTWTYSPLQYWPANESVDFYAYAPTTWVGETGPLLPIAYDAITGDEDIVYAVIPDQKGNTGQPNAQVIFNFRHALSKLTIKLSSSDAKLKVVVTNVAMSNIMTKGNFNFPSASTADPASPETVGTWTDQNTPYSYILHWSQALSEMLTLTQTPTVIAASGMGRGGTMFVLPQPLTYRSNGNGNDTYIAVQCSISDVASGEKLWPNENTPKDDLAQGSTTGDGILRFPLSTSKYSEWQPGCHYIYNLVINSNDDMGAIEFGTPSVDTFIDVETSYQ
ncbi:fimbrillin family protein [Barnesiella sp. WM24]|uniref:fimbrillin family protein n=1 Tax=Barnesiella sp. WM24 TaxID=2558278 RepID=UPI0010727E7D|nr:fimbrillin family protein [Barnesiella sp. WM24]TFU91680.1 fimbrillin family protein [Barnesiella sp. WM24]